MTNLLKELESISLSNYEVLELINGKANLIQYPELATKNNIDEILHPYGACIILYLTRKNYGHWCCLFRFKDDPNLLEFFDPYGLFVDDELNFKMNENFRKINNQDYPHLTHLLYISPYKISYNQYKFQKKLKGVATCGRHTSMRLLLRDLPLDNYKKFMTSTNYTPDELVTMLTTLIMNKNIVL